MDIDEIYREERFRELDTYLTNEMNKYAGKELVKEMKITLGSENTAKKWFYSRINSLAGKRPYDYCKEGKTEEIKHLLGRINNGIY